MNYETYTVAHDQTFLLVNLILVGLFLLAGLLVSIIWAFINYLKQRKGGEHHEKS